MAYHILADFVVVVHFCFVVFVVLGGLLALRWHSAMKVHLPAAVWGVLLEFAGWTCPLTPLENWLRNTGTEVGYRNSFVEYYLLLILYPESLTRNLQIALGLMVLTINLAIYWRVLSRAP